MAHQGGSAGGQAGSAAGRGKGSSAWGWPAARQFKPFVKGSDLESGDIVAAYFTAPYRHSLIEAGREWRKDLGIRTVVVTSVPVSESGVPTETKEQFSETWDYWPDISDENGTLDIGSIAYFPGDHRGAMTPILAHKNLGETYKWMLYGDDDTIFFPEGVARAIHGLDPDLPYFLGDRSWGFGFGDGMDHALTPRCVPCKFDNPRGFNESTPPIPPFAACPCDRVKLCEHWREYKPELFPECRPENLDMPVPHHFTFHGGGGAIFSIGLLRALNATQYEDCVKSMRWRQGSDSYTTKCIWRGGFGMTDPGWSYFEKDVLAHFTFDRWTFRGGNPSSLVEAMRRKVVAWKPEAGFCLGEGANATTTGCTVPDEEDELFATMVSCHGMAGSFPDPTHAADGMNLASTVYREYMDAVSQTHPEAMHLDVRIGAGGEQ